MLTSLFASNKRPFFRGHGRVLEKRVFDLSGCTFEISMPPHDYDFPEESREPTINVFDSEIYDYDTEKNKRGLKPHFKGISDPSIFLRKWDSFGNLFQGSPIGKLQCNATICDTSKMRTGINCFNKKHLENLMRHTLYYNEGPGFGYKEHTAPANWNIKHLHGTEWIYCESWAKQADWEEFKNPSDDTNFSVWMITPLFEDKYLLIVFSTLGSLLAEPSNKLMFERMNQIIPTIKLNLAPEAIKQKESTERNHPHLSYSQHRDPEPWKYYSDWHREPGYSEPTFEGGFTLPPKIIE